MAPQWHICASKIPRQTSGSFWDRGYDILPSTPRLMNGDACRISRLIINHNGTLTAE